MGTNLATYNLDPDTVTARNAEYTGTPFTDDLGSATYADPVLGCNRAGSNAPGIGINTGGVNPKLSDWTVLDQEGNARAPQDSQHIGGDGLGQGDTSVNPLQAADGTDINDTLTFIEVIADAADGQGVGAANAEPLNRTGGAVVVGDRIWATDTVA